MQKPRIHLGLLLAAVSAICWSTAVNGELCAQEIRLEQLQTQIFQVVEQTTPAIVEIRLGSSIFSGVIVSPDGHVLSAGHTVIPGQRCTVTLRDGRRFSGQALGACEQMRGERLDCGLIRIQNAQRLPHVPLGNSGDLQPMQPCLSISYPGGQRHNGQPLVRFGWIERPSQSGRMIQSTALMEPGDSGGPLLDLDGRLIGIHSRIGTRMNQNYDVPIDVFKKHWDALNIPQTFTTQSGRTVPRLGFIGRDAPRGEGITVVSVIEGSIAEQLGLQPNDVLTKFQDQSLSGLSDLHTNLMVAVESQNQQNRLDPLSLAVKRGEDQLEYLVPTERLIIPRADRIDGLDNISISKTKWNYPNFDWNNYLSDQGRNYGGSLASVSSQVGGRTLVSTATRIQSTPFVVGKSSMVGDQPQLLSHEQNSELTVVARSSEHDLVLLRLSQNNSTGVTLDYRPTRSTGGPGPNNSPRQGQFLWSPQGDGSVQVSVKGCDTFTSPRVDSRGYLGVVLRDHQSSGVELIEVDEGAAKQAGLRVGDVILRMDNSAITGRTEMLRFLRGADPATSVLATVRRDSEEFQTAILLGSAPQFSSHAADLMDKSLRRDGFPKVFCHDATINPSDCGGPVFDQNGNWVAINIARYSRVRAFAIPAEVVHSFVEPYLKQQPQ